MMSLLFRTIFIKVNIVSLKSNVQILGLFDSAWDHARNCRKMCLKFLCEIFFISSIFTGIHSGEWKLNACTVSIPHSRTDDTIIGCLNEYVVYHPINCGGWFFYSFRWTQWYLGERSLIYDFHIVHTNWRSFRTITVHVTLTETRPYEKSSAQNTKSCIPICRKIGFNIRRSVVEKKIYRAFFLCRFQKPPHSLVLNASTRW